jgi:hypothetical protein
MFSFGYVLSTGRAKPRRLSLERNALTATVQVVQVLFVNTDQIVAITAGNSTTEVQMADGRSRWVKETPEEVAALAKSSA